MGSGSREEDEDSLELVLQIKQKDFKLVINLNYYLILKKKIVHYFIMIIL